MPAKWLFDRRYDSGSTQQSYGLTDHRRQTGARADDEPLSERQRCHLQQRSQRSDIERQCLETTGNHNRTDGVPIGQRRRRVQDIPLASRVAKMEEPARARAS